MGLPINFKNCRPKVYEYAEAANFRCLRHEQELGSISQLRIDVD